MTADIDLSPFFSAQSIEDAYQKYKASKTNRYPPHEVKIPLGADGITWQDFERNLDKNVRNISRRVLNGSYQFYPLRVVEKPKPDGGRRPLSIASIRDAIVQRQLYKALYESAEVMFSPPKLDKVSFAYRRGKSAPYAARRIWQSYKGGGYRYAFDADIRKFFDSLNHKRLMDLISAWVGHDTVLGTLLWRYIRTDCVPHDSYPKSGWREYFMTHKPQRSPRRKGVPQGGVLSGLLANLYLHEFDHWVVEELSKQVDLRYYRYADDFVMLTRSAQGAEALRAPVADKLEELYLNLHPDKTFVRDLATEGLIFVGFQFKGAYVTARRATVKKFKDNFRQSLAKEQSLKGNTNNWRKRLRQAVRWRVNPKILGPQPEHCATCGRPRDRRRNWMAAFASVVNDVDQLRQLDRWMRRQICRHFREHYHVRLGLKDLRQAGLKSLVREYYRQREQTALCTCPEAESQVG